MGSSRAASVTAVIAAAGSGERLGAGVPKAFVPLAGRPMVEWSITAFRACEAVGSIVVVCPPEHVHGLEDDDLVLVDGGETRSQSVTNALAVVRTELATIHDAARPLVAPELIEGVIAALAAYPEADGAIAATPVTDTIKQAAPAAVRPPPSPRLKRRLWSSPRYNRVKPTVSVEGTIDRDRLWAAQTPQVFRVEALRRALEGDPQRAAAATDEATLVEAGGGRVLIHPAPAENLKVTTPLDLKLAELLLAERSAQ
jgi:2-C-methyl-D-erythritol 4-phosphate cytidylyltransferase